MLTSITKEPEQYLPGNEDSEQLRSPHISSLRALCVVVGADCGLFLFCFNPNSLSAHNSKSHRISDENVQILIKDSSAEDGATRSMRSGTNTIELQSIRESVDKQQALVRRLEYEKREILEEYQRYKERTEQSAKDNLQLIEQYKALTAKLEEYQHAKALEDGGGGVIGGRIHHDHESMSMDNIYSNNALGTPREQRYVVLKWF